jgi:hypothetical protein
MKTIHIGCASGFWGDSFIAAPQLLSAPKLDYLVFDYLAEITMSILARAKSKNPEHGYALDFVDPVMKNVLSTCAAKGIKVVSNAGGLNPVACGEAIKRILTELGLSMKVAVVTGDDLSGQLSEIRSRGVKEMFRGDELPESLMSVNAYLGAFPIAQALARGADIVITGRCVDSAVTLGPCIHEFQWKPSDLDPLAGGSLAGHIIECGAQATGGLFTDWRKAGDWSNIGYPIVEVSPDGSFVVSKPPNTGGIVCAGGVAEQLVYEIGDPACYILPDVVCDFTQVKIDDVGPNLVRVWGARGRTPTDTFKVTATYFDGFRITCSLTIRGIDAQDKARHTVDAVLKRVRGMLKRRGAPDFSETNVEILGTEAGYGPHSRIPGAREVIARLGAKHVAQEALAVLLRELTSAATSMSPGTTGDGSNRPKPSPVVRLFSFLIDKTSVVAHVHIDGQEIVVPVIPGEPLPKPSPRGESLPLDSAATLIEVPLIAIAHGRSGDKGNDANIGIIARKPEYYPAILSQLTAENVADYFEYLGVSAVERFELPGISAVNFLLHDALGGGGIASLRQDPQGKALAQILLEFPVGIHADWAKSLQKQD